MLSKINTYAIRLADIKFWEHYFCLTSSRRTLAPIRRLEITTIRELDFTIYSSFGFTRNRCILFPSWKVYFHPYTSDKMTNQEPLHCYVYFIVERLVNVDIYKGINVCPFVCQLLQGVGRLGQ